MLKVRATRSRSSLLAIAALAASAIAAPSASADTQTIASGSTPVTASYLGPRATPGTQPASTISNPGWAMPAWEGARWIGYIDSHSYWQGDYVYTTTLTVPQGMEGSVDVRWSADDCTNLTVNGGAPTWPIATGANSQGECTGGGFVLLQSTQPLRAGENTLTFRVHNHIGGQVYGYTGLVFKAVATYAVIPPPDADNDGVPDASDNCPALSNVDQTNFDAASGDKEGDACDTDIDGDGTLNEADWAPLDPGEQKDSDGDKVGDNADAFDTDASETTDTDKDSVGDNGDNCKTVANNDQSDLDGDEIGDACDSDADGDGVPSGTDFDDLDESEQKDTDGDGIGDNADRFPLNAGESADSDNDGTGDVSDNCSIANEDQADLDKDGTGDACDDDVDGDGVANGTDNAPRTPNADQQDLDKDGVGDVIDTKVLPLSGDACKKDGWKRYYDNSARFKNQGDCVSFVATGGRNLPAGS